MFYIINLLLSEHYIQDLIPGIRHSRQTPMATIRVITVFQLLLLPRRITSVVNRRMSISPQSRHPCYFLYDHWKLHSSQNLLQNHQLLRQVGPAQVLQRLPLIIAFPPIFSTINQIQLCYYDELLIFYSDNRKRFKNIVT